MSIIKIDFTQDKLLWFENPKSRQVIDSLIKAIKINTVLLLFNVFKIEENVYSLCPKTEIQVNDVSFRNGWLHRAIVFYLSKWFLNANLIERPILPCRMFQQWYFDIKKIKIVDDEDEYLKRSKRYWNYL